MRCKLLNWFCLNAEKIVKGEVHHTQPANITLNKTKKAVHTAMTKLLKQFFSTMSYSTLRFVFSVARRVLASAALVSVHFFFNFFFWINFSVHRFERRNAFTELFCERRSLLCHSTSYVCTTQCCAHFLGSSKAAHRSAAHGTFAYVSVLLFFFSI